MTLVFLFICIVLTVFFPFLSLPLTIFGIIFTSGRIRKTYGFLLAYSLAVLSYIWIPSALMDLSRFHQQVGLMSGFNVDQLSSFLGSNLEPAHYFIEFLVAQTGDYNLLQFSVVLAGYFCLFWMVCDFVELRKIGRGMFVLLLLFSFSAIRFIDFASGLWFTYAVINIGLGLYLAFFRGTKYLQYFFFLWAICLHIGVLPIVLLLLLFYKNKAFAKVGLLPIIAVVLIALLFGVVVSVLNEVFGSDSLIAVIANDMFNSYFVNWSVSWGFDYSLRLMVLCLGFMLAYGCSKKKDIGKYSCLVFYLSLYVLITTFFAQIFSRYSFLVAITSVPLLYSTFERINDKCKRLLLLGIVLILSFAYLSSSISQIYDANLDSQINKYLTRSLIDITGDK